MAFETADTFAQNFYRPAARDLSHELRTPLAIIRMQAQLLIRLMKRSGGDWPRDRDRFITGLQRIDDAVSKMNLTLEGVRIDGRDERPAGPTVH